MNEPGELEKFMERYEESPLLRALVQLIPAGGGAAAESAAIAYTTKVKRERERVLFEALDEDKVTLSEEVILSEDFIHKWWITYNAAMRTRRHEKIRRFAKLLSASTKPERLESLDEFEEELQVLEELSEREFRVLIILKRFEDATPRIDGQNDVQYVSSFWSEFCKEVETSLGIRAGEVSAILMGTARTACYEPIIGAYLNYGGGMGHTAPRFRRLVDLIQEQGH